MRNRNSEKYLRKELKSVLLDYKIDKLHVGCGWDNFPKDWLNIGRFNDKNFKLGTIKLISRAFVLNFDLNHNIPIKKGTIQYIYGSHFIEHFTLPEALSILKRFHDLMKPGGIIRLTTPDLGLWIENYYENRERFFKRFYELSPSKQNLKTKGQILIGQAYGWGHKWLYDFESLKSLFKEAGFRKIMRKKHHESFIEQIELIEPDSELRRMETLYVEAMR